MIILTDTTGITIKRCIDDTQYVRLSLFHIRFFNFPSYEGCMKELPLEKPHNEFSISEMEELLNKLERLIS
jgi:hypothetical protein